MKFELGVPVALASGAARDALLRVMHSMGKGTATPDQLELSVYLRDLHAGVRGEIRIPVTLDVVDRPARFEYAIAIRAASDEGFFPHFEGTLSVTPVGTQSELWLQGTYDPPFGPIGALLDRTVLRHAAKRSLESFLQRIADDVESNERATEEQHQRSLRGMHP
ncbi:MAG: SRPBCC family protein [Candidatus Aquilonibacter sp.]